MTGLTAQERARLESVVQKRLGKVSDAPELVQAYLDAMQRNAYFRTTDDGPVPTSLTAERTAILVEISRQLSRLVEDVEIQALFRVSPSTARSMRVNLLATYTDDADALLQAWSLRGAHQAGRAKHRFLGTLIVFPARDRRDAFVSLMERAGTDVEVLRGDDGRPWLVNVGDAFPSKQLPPK